MKGDEILLKNLAKYMGERIKVRRKALHISQAELADKLDRQQKTVSQWETGTNYLQTKDIPDIANALECDISYLFCELPTDCPTHVLSDVSEETGLSPQAVEFLQANDYADIVSALITHPEFVGICERIRELQDKEALSKAQTKIWVDGIWERANGKAFPKVIVSDALFSGARTCFERILTDLVEEE